MIKQAIPTEYRGVKFDSKSEAVFARLMDLNGIDWEREHPIRHEGHEWDFLIWLKDFTAFTAFENGLGVHGGAITFGREIVSPCLIELKPSEPTESYLRRLEKGYGGKQRERRMVVWGNPWGDRLSMDTEAHQYERAYHLWDGIYTHKEFTCKKTWRESYLSWLEQSFRGFDSESRISEAKSYRFDLR